MADKVLRQILFSIVKEIFSKNFSLIKCFGQDEISKYSSMEGAGLRSPAPTICKQVDGSKKLEIDENLSAIQLPCYMDEFGVLSVTNLSVH